MTLILNNSDTSNTKHDTGSSKELIKKYIGITGLLIMPVISYILFESVTGNLASIAWQKALLNIGWNYCIYLILFSISGTTRFAVPFGSILLLIISMVEAFVVEFRDRPIMAWDIMAFGTAMTVTKNYSFVLSVQMKTAIASVTSLNIALFFFPFHVKGLKKRLAALATGAVYTCGYTAFFFYVLMPKYNYEINVWDLNSTYEQYGYMLSTAISSRYVIKRLRAATARPA